MHVFKKKKKAPIFKKKERLLRITEAWGFKYNKIILFLLINTSFGIHKNNTYQKKKENQHRIKNKK